MTGMDFYDLVCPNCKKSSDHGRWSLPRPVYWTDCFGEIKCPECGLYSAEDRVLVKRKGGRPSDAINQMF